MQQFVSPAKPAAAGRGTLYAAPSAMECLRVDLACTANGTDPPATAASSAPDVSFHDILSALNPLQYVPVVGSIYRAVTGNVPPEPIRTIGSLLVSGLTGGPIGLAINAGVTAVEKISGIDPDQIVHGPLRGRPHRRRRGRAGPSRQPGRRRGLRRRRTARHRDRPRIASRSVCARPARTDPETVPHENHRSRALACPRR
jgi:hypothetical protein